MFIVKTDKERAHNEMNETIEEDCKRVEIEMRAIDWVVAFPSNMIVMRKGAQETVKALKGGGEMNNT